MIGLYFVLALVLVLVGHAFRLLRWEQFIRIYERPPRGQMLRGMAGGYALNFVLPFHLGDAFRAVYTGRRMKSGIGFALATVIMDRFLDVWFVAFGFIAFRLLGLGGAPVDGAARYYLVFSLLLVLGLVLVVALRDFLKKICLAFCGLFNDTLKLDGMMFFWSLINTFKDLGRVKIGRLADDGVADLRAPQQLRLRIVDAQRRADAAAEVLIDGLAVFLQDERIGAVFKQRG